MPELVGIGFAALGEGLAQLVRFLAVEIGAQQEVVRQAGEAADEDEESQGSEDQRAALDGGYRAPEGEADGEKET